MNNKPQIHLSLILPVSINNLYVNKYKYDTVLQKRVPTGARVLSNKGLMNKKIIQKQAMKQLEKQEWDYLQTKDKNNHFYMDVIIYFPKKGMDADNIFKVLNDSLQGIIFDNDSRILPRTQRIMYNAENPHIEVVISKVDYIGIFDNLQEFNEFVEHCETCRFHQNGKCSILKNAIESRIQEEIENMICKKYVKKK